MLDVDINFTKYHYYWFRLCKKDSGLEWGEIERHDHNDLEIEQQFQTSEKLERLRTITFTKSGYSTIDLCSLSESRLKDVRFGIICMTSFDEIFDKTPKVGEFE